MFSGSHPTQQENDPRGDMFRILVVGPLVVFATVIVALIIAYGWSNSGEVEADRAMSENKGPEKACERHDASRLTETP